jgi:hypothetical protein
MQTDTLPDGASAGRGPWLGLGLASLTVVFCIALVVYFAAWAASERVEARALSSAGNDAGQRVTEKVWWEDGARWACPLH